MLKNNIKIKINSSMYPKDTIFKVVDILSNEYIVEIESGSEHFLLSISAKYKKNISFEEIKKIFFDHLNHQVARDKIYKETHALRELIVGKALFETEAFDNDSSFFDIKKYNNNENYIVDIENIAKPFNYKKLCQKKSQLN